uniref:Uncharacterized protein n=1 Tax=Chromera velia CCMP2878 TaxID=1169474 RepID=A0A0G4G7N7_9ALVE|eukprot:Cvel_20559.t1-p1 / transcript=Cvel_20559.t1 / gene=Cvel_20559 / organism=Chromera_velia_CCMP2878 / gene_product=Uncharacterized protein L426, putative / transcript_product=Uncharacterized protein L426, putative / location=Cvel_scaffold1856:13167-14864(+) / protein_length=230 / sequence_SO=supercontig / SO=protein_coding / is_pseudo=false
MSWENYGSLWHVDHIVPIQYRGADGQKPGAETQLARLHFTNLQPMWSKENLRKGNRQCGGGGICHHNRHRSACSECQRDNPAFAARRQRAKEARKIRYKEDAVFRLGKVTRSTVAKCIANIRKKTSAPCLRKRTHEYLGCSFPDLKAHLEKDNFHGNPGMSWENYGSLWHIDHIVPIMYAGPDGQKPDMETVASRLHFLNLQPMWGEENLRKGNRFVGKPPRIPLQSKML